MNKRMTFALAVLLAATMTRDAAAQWNPVNRDMASNRVYMTIGLDPAIVTSIGYARVVPIAGHAFQIATDVGMAGTEFDTRDFRARIAFESSLVSWRSVHLSGSAAFLTRGTDNSVYRGLNFGADFTGSLGVYREQGFAAVQFGKDKAIITHVTHTDWYRDQVYDDARDGWYLDAGGAFHYGLTGGITLGPAELVGRAGFLRSEKFDRLTPPVYGSLGLGFGF